ncbi:MAG: YkgJ family cysteine cluster protein [Pseudomonadota bacterium]
MAELRNRCIRCGECCLHSSPVLHKEDLPLLSEEKMLKKDLITIRKGELVRDNVNGGLTISSGEMVKIREVEDEISGGCVFYEEKGKACGIYENRPAQCRALKCWDTGGFMRVFKGPKAERRDVLDDPVIRGLVEEHDRRCSYAALEEEVKRIGKKGERAVEKILDLLKFDYHLRPFISEKLGIPPEEMDFWFGRPLIKTLHMFGLQVLREPDGTFLLTRTG